MAFFSYFRSHHLIELTDFTWFVFGRVGKLIISDIRYDIACDLRLQSNTKITIFWRHV